MLSFEEAREGYQDGSLSCEISRHQLKMLISHDITRRYVDTALYQKLRIYKFVGYFLLGLGIIITLDALIAGTTPIIGLLIATAYFPARSALHSVTKGYIIHAALTHQAYFNYLIALDVMECKRRHR